MPGPSKAAVDAAIAAQLISYRRSFSGGAHTNGAFFGGASITLGVASYAGDSTADDRLLQQIRHTLTSGNEPTSNGGYPAQHERHITGMFTLAKYTPRIWDQLSAAEKADIDVLMKSNFVACAFTTSDNNPFIKAGSQQYSLDADSNLNRGWNPNYREGMIGGVIAGIAYFGPAGADAVLNSYNHAQFVGDLNASGFINTYETFNWRTANPSSNAPTGSQIETGVRTYRYYGLTVYDYMKIYESLVKNTYGENVNAGLNGGAGIGGAGKIVSGADTLPNKGALGMLKEFDSSDANGARSSALYSYDGLRPHQTNQLVLIVAGLWTKGSAIANDAVTRIEIGNRDFWYKVEKGYIGYAKGKAQALLDSSYSSSRGFVYVRAIWDEVLRPYHGLSDPDPDPEPPPPVGKFIVGGRVQTGGSTPVKAAASSSSTQAGTQAAGAFGTVVAGPTSADGVTWWQINFDGGADGWVDETGVNSAPASESLVATAGGAWKNLAFPAKTGTVNLAFNMRPDSNGIDALAGFSAATAGAYSDLAIIIRFSPAGVMEARNGGAYAAVNAFSYSAGVTYRVQITANLSTRRFTATVAAPTGVPVVIADNYAFRTEQASISSLANFAAFAQSGAQTSSGLVVSQASSAPSPPTGLRRVN